MTVQPTFYHPDILHAQQPACSIIIPLYNGVEHTRQALESLAKNSGNNCSFELILIDNGTTDATAEYLRTISGNVTVLTNRLAFSSAKACNQGARLAVGEFLFFLRQSVCPQEGWLEPLIAGVMNEGAEIAGGRVLFADGRVQHAGIVFDNQSLPYNIFSGFAGDLPAVCRRRFLQAVSGSCMLVRKELFQRLGGFDELYSGGLEDADLCLRAGLQGEKVIFEPESLHISLAGNSDTASGGYQGVERFLSAWHGKVVSDDTAVYQSEGFVKRCMPDGRTYILPAEGSQPADLTVLTEKKSKLKSSAQPPSNPLASAEEWYTRATDYLVSGRKEEAIHALEQSLAANPAFPQACNDLGVLLVQQGDLDRALALHEQAVTLNPGNTVFRKNLADLYFAGFGRVDDAVAIYTDLIARTPHDVESLCALGQISISVNRSDEARIFLGRALELDSANDGARHLLQDLNNGTAMPISVAPAVAVDVDELYRAACRMAEVGDRSGAIRELEGILRVDAKFALAYNDLAVLYLQDGDKNRSLRAQLMSVELAPENVIFRKNLAGLYLVGMGRTEEAKQVFADLLKADPEDVETLLALTNIALQQKKTADAAMCCRKILMVDPANRSANDLLSILADAENSISQHQTETKKSELYCQAKLYVDAGDTAAAIKTLADLQAAEPYDPAVYNDLGVLFWRSGDLERAKACHEKAVELAPGNVIFGKNLADLYAVAFGWIDESVNMLVGIIEANPSDAEALLSLGQLCIASGRLDDARIIIQRAVELEPVNELARQLVQELRGDDFFLAR